MTRHRTEIRSTRRGRGETGSAATELVVLVPMAVLIVGFIILVGRMSSTQQDVNSAARDSARAASVNQTPGAGAGDARAVAEATLGERDVSCSNLSVDVDTSQFVAGGQVAVTVSCTVEVADLLGLGIPGGRELTSTSVAVIDTYRGGDE